MDQSVRSGRVEIVCGYSFNQAVWSAKILEVVPFDTLIRHVLHSTTNISLNIRSLPLHAIELVFLYASSILQVILFVSRAFCTHKPSSFVSRAFCTHKPSSFVSWAFCPHKPSSFVPLRCPITMRFG